MFTSSDLAWFQHQDWWLVRLPIFVAALWLVGQFILEQAAT